VQLEFEENGHKETETMRVVYRGITMIEADELEKRMTEGIKEGNHREVLIAWLAESVIELPDLVDGDQPVKPSVEFFGSLDTKFLSQIHKTIVDDRVGND
jgi:hypothetical protein